MSAVDGAMEKYGWFHSQRRTSGALPMHYGLAERQHMEPGPEQLIPSVGLRNLKNSSLCALKGGLSKPGSL
jgi:hypothetical protein